MRDLERDERREAHLRRAEAGVATEGMAGFEPLPDLGGEIGALVGDPEAAEPADVSIGLQSFAGRNAPTLQLVVSKKSESPLRAVGSLMLYYAGATSIGRDGP